MRWLGSHTIIACTHLIIIGGVILDNDVSHFALTIALQFAAITWRLGFRRQRSSLRCIHVHAAFVFTCRNATSCRPSITIRNRHACVRIRFTLVNVGNGVARTPSRHHSNERKKPGCALLALPCVGCFHTTWHVITEASAFVYFL